MDQNDLTQRRLDTSPDPNPSVALDNAHWWVSERELYLSELEEYFEAFDMESIYKVGWSENGHHFYTKCQTRQSGGFYFVAGQDGVEQRFRRAEVEVAFSEWSDLSRSSYSSLHVGRFVYDDLMYDLSITICFLECDRRDLFSIEERIALGRHHMTGFLEEAVEMRIEERVVAGRPPIVSAVEEWSERRKQEKMTEMPMDQPSSAGGTEDY
jgi:hypothetical protein